MKCLKRKNVVDVYLPTMERNKVMGIIATSGQSKKIALRKYPVWSKTPAMANAYMITFLPKTSAHAPA